MKDHKRDLDVIAGGIKFIVNVLNIIHNDLGCDWYCDNCDALLNKQFGFSAGNTWTCTKCGYLNDVSEDNIVSTYTTDDGLEVIDIPSYDFEDAEDY